MEMRVVRHPESSDLSTAAVSPSKLAFESDRSAGRATDTHQSAERQSAEAVAGVMVEAQVASVGGGVAESQSKLARAEEESTPLTRESDRSGVMASLRQEVRPNVAGKLSPSFGGDKNHISAPVMQLFGQPEPSAPNLAEAQAAVPATSSSQCSQQPGQTSGAQFLHAEVPGSGKSSSAQAPAMRTPSPKSEAQQWRADAHSHSSSLHRDLCEEAEQMQRAIDLLKVEKLELQKSEVGIPLHPLRPHLPSDPTICFDARCSTLVVRVLSAAAMVTR